MNTLEILRTSVETKKPICFEYNKQGKIAGRRIGHSYAVFIFTAKNTRIQSTKVHIVQVDGVPDSIITNPFPSFRMYNIEDLSNLYILDDNECFAPPYHEDYNSEWEGYKDVIIRL